MPKGQCPRPRGDRAVPIRVAATTTTRKQNEVTWNCGSTAVNEVPFGNIGTQTTTAHKNTPVPPARLTAERVKSRHSNDERYILSTHTHTHTNTHREKRVTTHCLPDPYMSVDIWFSALKTGEVHSGTFIRLFPPPPAERG